MTYKEIQNLLKQMSEYDLSEIRIKDGDFEITVRTASYSKNRGVQPTLMAPQAIPVAAAPMPTQESPPAASPGTAGPAATPESSSDANLLDCLLYTSPSPRDS